MSVHDSGCPQCCPAGPMCSMLLPRVPLLVQQQGRREACKPNTGSRSRGMAMPGAALAPPGRRRLTPSGAAAAAGTLLVLALALGCAPRPAAAAVKPSDSSDQGGELELQFAANKNRDGAPIGTVTKAEVAGRTVYYEVPQVRPLA